jgi:heme/copper-type cytochrome/quinol oxidase subunit 1
VFAIFAGFFFWMPKMTGRFLDERLGKIQFWIMLIGFNLTFFPMHILGLNGMQRRIADYPANSGLTGMNQLATLGSALIALSILIFVVNFVLTLRKPRTATADPWEANTLEWATSSPPPPQNFTELIPVRSERPVFDFRETRKAAQEAERARVTAAGDEEQP